MTGSNHARCTPSISAIYLRSRCWPSGRILPDELTFITSPIAFSRRFHCKRPSTTINWKRTVLVLVRQSVGRDEELLLSVLKSPSKTELVATIKRRCVAASTHQRRTRSQHRYLLVLPRTHTTLNARVHRDKGACPPAR